MKINNSAAESISNVENTYNYGIGNMNLVMQILSNLYSNPIQTLTQEYICNGRDANRESGSKKPIEIAAPSTFKPELIIRDFGLGLSPERIEKVFLLYGASTKQGDNLQTGGFGIGAKSAWSYTDSFTVTSYYNGIKTVYVCHKSNGSGNMDILETGATSEVNGVEIRIPVKNNDMYSFQNAIQRCVYFWDEKERPNVNIVDIKYFEGTEEKFLAVDRSGIPSFIGYDNQYLIIDGIAYPFNFLTDCGMDKIDDLLTTDRRLFFLDNGQVEIAPNREEIIANDKSKNALKILIDKESIKLKKIVSELFKDCKIDLDRLKVYKEYSGKYKLVDQLGDIKKCHGWRSNGDYVIKDFEVTPCQLDKNNEKVLKNKPQASFYLRKMFYNDLGESPIIINRRIRKFLTEGDDCSIYLIDEKLADFNKFKTQLDIKPLSSLPLPDKVKTTKKAQRGNARICVHYKTRYYYNKSWVKVGDITKTTVYAPLNLKHSVTNLGSYIVNSGIDFCVLSTTNIKKIKDNDNFVLYTEWVKNFKPTTDDIDNLIYNKYNDSIFSDLVKRFKIDVELLTRPTNRISHPELLKEIIEKNTDYLAKEKTVKKNKEIVEKLRLLRKFSSDEYNTYETEIQEYINFKLGV